MAATATALIALENGIVFVRVRDGALMRPSDARENLTVALSQTDGTRRPILVDITKCPPLEAETRHVYSGQLLVDGFTALALLIEASPLGRMMGNMYLRVAASRHPDAAVHQRSQRHRVAARVSIVSTQGGLTFARDRVMRFLEQLERLAAGDDQASLDISPLHDELDAIAFGIKVLADELRWAHEQMTESERVNFAIAFHFNPCAMAIVRRSDNQFQDVNQSFERQTGYSRDEVVGRTREQVGLWLDAGDLEAIAANIRSGRPVVNREIRYRTKAGATATALYSADIILFRGEPCILSASVDVTDRVRAEEAAATLRWELAHRGRVIMLDALTASLAHEINQPLTAIMSNAHVALELANGPCAGDRPSP